MTNSPIVNGTTQYVCVGWIGTGSAPASGNTTNTGSFVLTNDSSITWQWTTNYWAETGTNGSDYMIVDLSSGPVASNYPVSYVTNIPPGGWTDEYKTTKMVFRRIPAGTFTMGSPTNELGLEIADENRHLVTLTQPYYIGVFEVTQKQWERVMGTWPSYYTNASCRDSRPVEQVSYNDIRGTSAGAGWPASNSVDASSFMGKLRSRTGGVFDLPTESQWEYAGRAGSLTALNTGNNLTNSNIDGYMSAAGRYLANGGSNSVQSVDSSGATAKVGSYQPNQWGLYDIHGNDWEWCLDWYGAYPGTVSDPKGAGSGSVRVMRGGSWGSYASHCRVAVRHDPRTPSLTSWDLGFRAALPLVSFGVSPSSGPMVGGTTVTINGSSLGNGSDITNVTICGVLALIQSQTSNSVTVIVGVGGSGVGDVIVKSVSRGITTFTGAYTYNPRGYISGNVLRWGSVSNLPSARGLPGAAVANGRIYVTGGYYFGYYSTVYSYDPAVPTQGWTSVTSLPAVRGCLSAESVGGKIYAMGGQDATEGRSEVYVYDPQQPGLGWLSVSNLPTILTRMASAVVNEKIYVLGGDGPGGTQSAVYEYDPQQPARGWRLINNLPVALDNLAATALDGKLYAIGGTSPGNYYSTVYVCDPSHAELGWSSISNLPAARYYLGAASLNGKIFAVGGFDSSQTGFSAVYMYDPAQPTQGWLSVSNLPAGKGAAPCVVVNGRMYIISGCTAELTFTPTVFEGSMTTGVTPSSGLKTGGTPVTIQGSNLGNGSDITNVTLCGVSVSSIISQSATQVVVTAGMSAFATNGAVTVYSTSYGVATRSNAFTYTMTYSIVASAGTNGAIVPAGNVTVEEGHATNFVVQANSGRHIAGVLVDGISVGVFGPGSNRFDYTFANVTTSHTISATFNTPPVVGVTATPASGAAPLLVQFNFAASSDEENNIVRCEVDKDGDGTIDASSATGSLVTVEYAAPGEYHPIARVVDAFGAASETNLLVIAHVNHPPVGNSAVVTTALNNATAIELKGSDEDGDSLSFNVTVPPVHGSLTGTGASRIYKPAADFIGEDYIRFTANDGMTNSPEAIITIKVTTALQKMKINIAGYTKGEALTNFPLLVVFSPGMLTNGFSYNRFASANGYDLRFTDESEKTNLNYEVETWDTNGTSSVWVQVPVVTNGGSLWAWWGDEALTAAPPACTTNGAVWDANYKAVWHLGEGSGNAADSTGAKNSGTLVAGVARAAGRVAGGAVFDGNTGEFAVNSTFGLGNASVTLEAMAYIESDKKGAFLKVGDNSSGYCFGIGGNYLQDVGQNYLMLCEGVRWIRPSVTLTTGWHHFAMVISASGVPSAVVDGMPLGSFAGLNAIAPTGSLAHIGGYLNTNQGLYQRHYNGLLDEVRISSVPRSTNWLWACWRNVSSNSVFNTLGEIVPGGKDSYGVPDDWKIRYFGGTGMPDSDSLDDSDHDGMNNLCEYLAGTNPTNGGSRLEIKPSAPMADGTNFLFRWTSVSGKLYAVDVATNLMEGFPIHAAIHIPATPEVNILTIRVDRATQKFFRVQVEP